MPILSLAYLTSAPLSPLDAIALAAELGYQAVGLRALPVVPGGAFSPLIEDAGLLRETIARMKATGVAVFDVEIVRLGANFDPETVRPFFETCQKLDAKAVLVAGDDPDEARLTASFVAFCEAAAPYGLTGDLEFMPWTKFRMPGPPNGSPSRPRSPTRACSSTRSMPDGRRPRWPTLRPCRARFSAMRKFATRPARFRRRPKG
jgi:hypothetical protein